MLKKSSGFIMALLFALTSVPAVPLSAAEFNDTAAFDIRQAPVSSKYLDYINNPDEFSLEPSTIETNLNSDIEVNSNLPEKFDLRSKGLVSPVRNQGIYGTCWAHAAVASMETSLINKNPFIDISEWQLAYFCTNSDSSSDIVYGAAYQENSADTDFEALFEEGGAQITIIDNITRWQGISNESRFPYEYQEITNEDYRYVTDYHVDDICMAFNNKESSDEVNMQVKELIYEGNALTMNFIAYDGFLNSETSAYFGSRENEFPNIQDLGHEVVIVGWDDNYSKENFREDSRPENDGAWLIKNSWGNSQGNNGYYWISYEDDYTVFDVSYKLDYCEDYDNIYQYDNKFNGWRLSYAVSDNNEGYMANVFTAERSEYLSGAGFYTTDNGTEYELTVYTDLADKNNPVSGNAHYLQSGTEKYTGYHTVDFSEGIYVEEGQTYSIVVKLKNPQNEFTIPTTNMPYFENEEDKAEYCNLSYVSKDGEKWLDSMQYPDDEMGGIGLVCCKVFSNNADKIEFSDYSPYVEKNTSISLSNDSGKDMYYSTDGETWSIYSEPIVIDDTKNIYASLSETGENAVSHKYSVKQAVLYSLHYDNITYYGDINVLDGENIITDITEYIPGYIKELTIIPTVSGKNKITINGEQVESGSDYTFNLKDTQKLEIVVSAENQDSTSYTVNFVKNYIDFYAETIMIDDEILTVTAPDGKVIRAWESISDYIGQTLTAEYNDGSGTFEIPVPERPDAPDDIEYEILYDENAVVFNQETYYSFSNDSEHLYAPVENNEYLYCTVENKGYFPATFASGKTMYVCTPASNTQFTSKYTEFKIPELSAAPDADIEAEDIQEHSISLKPVEGVEYGIFDMYFYEYEVRDAKLCKFEWSDSPEFTNLLAGHEYCFAIRYPATDENVYSDIKYAYFSTTGLKQVETIDYESEYMYLDDLYEIKVTDEDGNVINYNDDYECYVYNVMISEYTGRTLTVYNLTEDYSYNVEIPQRPDFNGEYSVDYNSASVTFTNNGNDIMYKVMNDEWRSLEFDNETNQGTFEFNSWINSEDDTIIYLKNPATSEQFESNIEIINIGKMPVCEYQIEIESATESSITVKPFENAEYAIIPFGSGYMCEFTDNNVFTGLTAGGYYDVFIRIKATDNTLFSFPKYTTVKIPENENDTVKTFKCGDIDGDGAVTSYDALFVLKHITNIEKLDEVPMSFADCDSSGSVDSYDALMILQYTTGMLDQLPVFDENAVG